MWTTQTGEYLTFLDDDDVWLAGHIRSHLALLTSDVDLGGVIGQTVAVDESSGRHVSGPRPLGLATKGALWSLFRSGESICGVVFRTAAWDTVGPFDTQFDQMEDWDWYLRLATRVRLAFIPQPCLEIRNRIPTINEDVLLRRRQTIGHRVFWLNLRRAGSAAPSNLAARRMWLRHDSIHASTLLSHARLYASQGNVGDARRTLMLAVRGVPLHILWKVARCPYERRGIWEWIRPSASRSSDARRHTRAKPRPGVGVC